MHTMEKLDAYKHQTEMSWMVIARGIGISAAVIHGLRKDYFDNITYNGGKEPNYRKIEDWLKLQQKRTNSMIAPIPFVKTSVSAGIWETLEYAWINRKMVSITGHAGRGKTASAEEWALKHDQAVYIDTFGSCNNVIFFNDVARTLRIEMNRSAGYIVKAAVKELYSSDKFFIIDNAHNLIFKTIENLRYIHEQAQIGIAFVGMPHLLTQMTENNILLWEQIYSRMAIRHRVKDLTIADTRKIVQSIAPGISDDWVRKAHEYAGGSTRELTNFIQRRRTEFKKSKTGKGAGLNNVDTVKPMKTAKKETANKKMAEA